MVAWPVVRLVGGARLTGRESFHVFPVRSPLNAPEQFDQRSRCGVWAGAFDRPPFRACSKLWSMKPRPGRNKNCHHAVRKGPSFPCPENPPLGRLLCSATATRRSPSAEKSEQLRNHQAFNSDSPSMGTGVKSAVEPLLSHDAMKPITSGRQLQTLFGSGVACR